MTDGPYSAKRVLCLYHSVDRTFRQQLGEHLEDLRSAGLLEQIHGLAGEIDPEVIENWALLRESDRARGLLEQTDLLLLLLSADLLANDEILALEAMTAEREGAGALRIIPIYVRAVVWKDSWLGKYDAVPTRPIDSWDDPDDAWRQVIPEIRRAVRPFIDEIFQTSGLPDINFVEPAQMTDLVDQLHNMGRGLVVEGPSGIGKTTAVKHALKQLRRGLRPLPRLLWLDGKLKGDVRQLRQLLEDDFQRGGFLVIDDFHRLPLEVQAEVANLIKIVSDSNRRDTKITLIGINPVGVSLVRDLHDVAGRFGSVYMGRQPDTKIDELIGKGQAVANVVFRQRLKFVEAAAGSFLIAQLLCYQACLHEGVREIQPELRTIESGPSGYVTDKVLQELKAKYHDALCDFAAICEAPPPQGATLVLLWLLWQSPEQSISLQIARNRYPRLATALDWLMASNLSTRLSGDRRLTTRFYYRRDAAILSADDPQLAFYLRNLNWEAFIRDTGHVNIGWDPVKGPLVGEAAVAATVAPAPVVSLPESWVLHLSDLHFGTQEQAEQWSGQLLQDLLVDVRPPGIDVVVLSGDIANRAILPEYQAAGRFIQILQEELRLSPEQIVLVPGNHDVNWDQSKRSYRPVRRADHVGPLREGEYIDGGAYVELLDAGEYARRLLEFSNFYHQVRLEPYSLDVEQQTTLHHFPAQKLLFLGLNSAWQLDHHHRARAGIHGVALGHALRHLRRTPAYQDCVKVAVWHHPLNGADGDRIKDTGFMELLAQAGFRVVLHGHIHKAQNDLYRYDRTVAGRQVEIIAAGTFGAPVPEWVPGHPLQYQLLQFSQERLRVHTRRRREVNGAWEPDASWRPDPAHHPLPYYDVTLGSSPRPATGRS